MLFCLCMVSLPHKEVPGWECRKWLWVHVKGSISLSNQLDFLLFLIKFIVVEIQLSAFPPITPLPPQPSPPPSPDSTLLGFVHVSFLDVPKNLPNPFSPSSPPISLPTSPLVTVRLFLISMSLVIFCSLFSFVDYVLVKGEIIWYLSLTAWLISLSIMLSSSIHAVAKDRSSFLSAA